MAPRRMAAPNKGQRVSLPGSPPSEAIREWTRRVRQPRPDRSRRRTSSPALRRSLRPAAVSARRATPGARHQTLCIERQCTKSDARQSLQNLRQSDFRVAPDDTRAARHGVHLDADNSLHGTERAFDQPHARVQCMPSINRRLSRRPAPSSRITWRELSASFQRSSEGSAVAWSDIVCSLVVCPNDVFQAASRLVLCAAGSSPPSRDARSIRRRPGNRDNTSGAVRRQPAHESSRPDGSVRRNANSRCAEWSWRAAARATPGRQQFIVSVHAVHRVARRRNDQADATGNRREQDGSTEPYHGQAIPAFARVGISLPCVRADLVRPPTQRSAGLGRYSIAIATPA